MMWLCQSIKLRTINPCVSFQIHWSLQVFSQPEACIQRNCKGVCSMYFHVFKIFLNICISSIKVVHIKNTLVVCSTVFLMERDMGISRALFTQVVPLRKSCTWKNDINKKHIESISIPQKLQLSLLKPSITGKLPWTKAFIIRSASARRAPSLWTRQANSMCLLLNCVKLIFN